MAVEYGFVDSRGDVIAIECLTIARAWLTVIGREAADEELILLGALDLFVDVDRALVGADHKALPRDLVDPYGAATG